jgi:hypothetical protein
MIVRGQNMNHSVTGGISCSKEIYSCKYSASSSLNETCCHISSEVISSSHTLFIIMSATQWDPVNRLTISEVILLISKWINKFHNKVQWCDQDHTLLYKVGICMQCFLMYKLIIFNEVWKICRSKVCTQKYHGKEKHCEE